MSRHYYFSHFYLLPWDGYKVTDSETVETVVQETGNYASLNLLLVTNLPDRIVFCVTSFRLKNFLIYS